MAATNSKTFRSASVQRLAAVVFVCALLHWAGGPHPAGADDVPQKLNNRAFVGEETDVLRGLEDARGYEGRGRHADALEAYESLLARADEEAAGEGIGGTARTLMLRQFDVPADYSADYTEVTRYHGRLYVPLTERILRAINELPAAQRQAYRSHTGVVAQSALDEAVALLRDPAELDAGDRDASLRARAAVQRVADRHILTPAGMAACELAAQLAAESGDHHTALYYWERLWEFDEARFLAGPLPVLHAAAAAAVIGDRLALERCREAVARRFDGTSITLGGTRIRNVLALFENDGERLRDLMPGFIDPPPATDRSTTFGNRRATAPAPDFSRLLRVFPPYELSDLFSGDDNNRSGGRIYMGGRPNQPEPRSTRNDVILMPVVVDGRMAFHGPVGGMIWDLTRANDRRQLPRRIQRFSVSPFLVTPEVSRTTYYYGYNRGREPVVSYVPTVHDGRLYCAFQPGKLGNNRNRYDPNAQRGDVLACVSVRDGGAIEWVTPSPDYLDPNVEDRDLLESARFGPNPLVIHDTLVVSASISDVREQQFYLMAFRLTDGKLLWRTQIGALATMSRGFGPRSNSNTAELAPLSADRGIVYVQTNAGLLAAVDGLTGAKRWVYQYERPSGSRIDPMRGMVGFEPHWANNPPIATGGNVYAGPLDHNGLIALVGRTGDLLRVYPQTPDQSRLRDLEYLLGVSNGALIIQGRERVTALDLAPDQRAATDPRDDVSRTERWYSAPLGDEREVNSVDFITGRGVLTTDAVVVPTRDGLIRIDAATGKRLAPSIIPWPTDLRGRHHGYLNVIDVPGDGGALTTLLIISHPGHIAIIEVD
jgi:outer membrane protein assembly factor BamB